ncbi:MAG: VPLPA-CTERM-specific exosortase XrtD [Acidiferrobacterales bacterium]
MKNSSTEITGVWKESLSVWLFLLGMAALIGFIFSSGLTLMVRWWHQPAYSYGYLIPFITLFLIWQKKDQLERIPFDGSWWGIIVVAMGVLLFLAGELSTLLNVIQYAFLVVTVGVVLATLGWRAFKVVWVPLTILVFMIPLPNFLFFNLTQQLQLISSHLGVWVIRLFNIPVFLQGNVIDLGVFKLQVARACSGLRYLFPLMTLGYIAAYFFKGSLWKRVLIFLSSIPITVLMNSFRVGMIGILVNYWGISMAQGFLHAFEGWVVFMACIGIIIGEMWVLAHIGRNRRPLREVFGLEFPAPTPPGAAVRMRGVPKPLIATASLLALVAVLHGVLPQRVEHPPQRTEFADFPMNFGAWHGTLQPLQPVFINALKFTDYIMADYTRTGHNTVNFYVAYYASQHAGDSAHSPRSCIPGGGWVIKSLSQHNIKGVEIAGQPLRVNRVLIQMGGTKQLVYYWFQEQGRLLTNEYLVKWFLFWDALTRNRSDGALVRLVTTIPTDETTREGDARLASFAKAMSPHLAAFVPD